MLHRLTKLVNIVGDDEHGRISTFIEKQFAEGVQWRDGPRHPERS